jgi:hypothetical protein
LCGCQCGTPRTEQKRHGQNIQRMENSRPSQFQVDIPTCKETRTSFAVPSCEISKVSTFVGNPGVIKKSGIDSIGETRGETAVRVSYNLHSARIIPKAVSVRENLDDRPGDPPCR